MHLRKEEIEQNVPNGDVSYREIPRSRPNQADCVNYFTRMSTILLNLSMTKLRISLQAKDDELVSQAVSLILESEAEETEKFKIQSFHELQV